jgi:GTP-binding protein Era
MVFLDTPGLLEPEYELHARMRKRALQAIADADVVVYVHDATLGAPKALAELAGLGKTPRAPVIVALNKVDQLTSPQVTAMLARVPDSVAVSAVAGTGVDALVARVASLLPEGPFLYPPDELSTQPVRFFAAELVRETALEQLDDEVPYAVACVIEEFREERTPVYIRATLLVERESQKRILIGAKGSRIRSLGTAARARIEALTGTAVYLDLWVKVQPHWRRDAHVLDRLGYGPLE